MQKVAVITGASRGIGRAVAENLAQQGYCLALIARDQQKLQELAEGISKQYPQLPKPLIFAIDVTDKQKIDEALARTVQVFKRIDVLLNNAGILRRGEIEKTYNDFIEIVNVNIIGVFNVLHAVVPYLKKQKSGYIFNLSSMSGKRGLANISAYASSKFAVTGLSESLFKELLPHGIKVTALCPSFVATDMTIDMRKTIANPTNAEDRFLDEEKIQPEDIVKTINYLLSLSGAACISDIMIQCKAVI